MSYFLCLAVPREAEDQLSSVFDKRVYLTHASGLPIGRATRGKNYSWASVIIQIGSSSASLIGKAGSRRTHNNDHTALLVSGIQRLLESGNCSAVLFLAHLMKGRIDEEQIVLKKERQMNLEELIQFPLEIEEDVRYLVSITDATRPAID